jgi:hypothetical protein
MTVTQRHENSFNTKIGIGKSNMKEYEGNHRGHREKISLSTPRSILRSSATAKDELWQAGLCSQKKNIKDKR